MKILFNFLGLPNSAELSPPPARVAISAELKRIHPDFAKRFDSSQMGEFEALWIVMLAAREALGLSLVKSPKDLGVDSLYKRSEVLPLAARAELLGWVATLPKERDPLEYWVAEDASRRIWVASTHIPHPRLPDISINVSHLLLTEDKTP